MHPTQEYEQIKIAGKNAVEITYELDHPVEHGLYSYLVSSIEDSESDEAVEV